VDKDATLTFELTVSDGKKDGKGIDDVKIAIKNVDTTVGLPTKDKSQLHQEQQQEQQRLQPQHQETQQELRQQLGQEQLQEHLEQSQQTVD